MHTKTPKIARSREGNRGSESTLPSLKFFGSEFVLNTETGMFYRVTPTAILILQAIQQGTKTEALADVIERHCAVSRMTAVRDVELLINELSVRGILTSNIPGSGK